MGNVAAAKMCTNAKGFNPEKQDIYWVTKKSWKRRRADIAIMSFFCNGKTIIY